MKRVENIQCDNELMQIVQEGRRRKAKKVELEYFNTDTDFSQCLFAMKNQFFDYYT